MRGTFKNVPVLEIKKIEDKLKAKLLSGISYEELFK
jgi:hypothetical protein